jgi:mono/diheme cytochrome c family protein
VSALAHRLKPLAAALAVLLLAVTASACGREEEPDLVNGKTLFVGQGTCGSCHALNRAGTQGTQGPDLDAAFERARQDGMNEETIEGIVEKQIANVRRGSIMPADLVTGDDARDVAAYVAFVAGQGGEDTGALAQAGAPKQSTKPVEAEGGTLEIAADPSGALAFVATKAIAQAGALKLVSPNESPVQHNIAVKDGSVDEKGPVVGQGGTSEVSAELEPGKYVFYCSVPGHEAGGMKGDLTVE